LDAYFGSGTTGSVCLKTNRKFIGIEQLDEHFAKSLERLTNVINGDKSGVSAHTS
jgi:adenine-specific DNA-methyltransferase